MWPYYKELIELLKKNFNDYEILTAPGPSEIGQCKNLNLKMILNNDKPTNIGQLTKVIKQSSFVIANDTGPAHIAAHLGTKGIVLFGSHVSAKKVSIETKTFKVIENENLKDLSVDTVFKSIQNQIFT